MGWADTHKPEDMVGLTFSSVTGKVGDEVLEFKADDGTFFRFYYEHDCCASCDIEDIAGDLQDLVGSPITLAEEVTNAEEPAFTEYTPESYTWTFYKFATIKGYVTVRYLGTSNGYYSESVSLTSNAKTNSEKDS